VLSFASILAINSGGPVNLVLNLAFVLTVLFAASRLVRSTLRSSDGLRIVVFGGRGFVGLCLYLILLYAVTYIYLNPGGLPSLSVQLFTFLFYAMAIAGLCLYRRREMLPEDAVKVHGQELKLVKTLFAILLGLALMLSPLAGTPVLFLPIVLTFVIWTPLGFLFTAGALVSGIREGIALTPANHR